MTAKEEARDKLYSRLYNAKFKTAMHYVDAAEMSERDNEVISALNRLFANTGCMDGDIGILLSAATCSIDGYVDWCKYNNLW